MSKEIKILRLLGVDRDCGGYETIEYDIVQGVTDWEVISNEDYAILAKWFRNVVGYPAKYVLVTKTDNTDDKLSVSKVLELCHKKEEDNNAKLIQKAQKELKRKQTQAKRQKEKDLQRLKELQEKLRGKI